MAAQTYIDGVEVTSIVLEGQFTRRLNRPSQASCRISIEDAVGDVGSKLKVVVNGTIRFHGFILTVSDEADENVGYTQYEALDPMELWNWRPARNHTYDAGNMITPTFFERLQYGPLIMEEILLASQEATRIPELAEGPLFLTIGTIAGGSTADLSGAPTNYPMTIAEIASLLTSTGVVDIVITPTDPGGGIMGTVSVYNGDYGTDRTATVFLDFATGNSNVRSVRQVKDGTNMTNKLQYFFGPKETLTRYKANITGDDTWLPGNLYGGSGPGGALPGRFAEAAPNDLGNRRSTSVAAYGTRMDIQEFDVDVIQREDQPGGTGTADPVRQIWRRLWQIEHWLRCEPRHLVHVTPIRNDLIGSFDIGDLVTVRAGAYLRGGFSGAQRIYEYTVNWDTEGVISLTEIGTSPSQEGF